ncbi:hypothetical protein BDZ97DRAFT_1810048 [Flammula alnicola]|nr:hypothetical protein BDZ97DRAFT_1810048 [Flammula alnicola]
MINNTPAWGALWNLETSTASPLRVISDTLCASGDLETLRRHSEDFERQVHFASTRQV